MQRPLERLGTDRVPADRPHETIDARTPAAPEPLQDTLESLAGLDDDTLLVQLNDRVPQHLYPMLDERGYEHETAETDDGVVTAVRRP